MAVNLTILLAIFNIVNMGYIFILKCLAADEGSGIVCT